MEIQFTNSVLDKLANTKKKYPKTYKRIQKQLLLFKETPTHPSLRTHKLKGKLDNTWSISIEDNLRMIYRFDEEGVVFFDMGTHDEVYKK